jgi:hypothetical protein
MVSLDDTVVSEPKYSVHLVVFPEKPKILTLGVLRKLRRSRRFEVGGKKGFASNIERSAPQKAGQGLVAAGACIGVLSCAFFSSRGKVAWCRPMGRLWTNVWLRPKACIGKYTYEEISQECNRFSSPLIVIAPVLLDTVRR